MKEQLINLKNQHQIVLLPQYDLDIKDSLENTLGNIIIIENEPEDKEIIEIINQSKIKKIYLVGNNEFYRFILPRIKKQIEVCWIFKNSFSDLSNGGVRYTLHCIMEFIDRSLIDKIGCINKDNLTIFKNAGYKCEYIDLKIKSKPIKQKKYKNTIGILSNDYDPNNNFYNQLAAMTFINYDYVKFKCIMGATWYFCDFFKIKNEKLEDFDEIIKDNVLNLYINFTNTNIELIQKSFQYGVPCIVGNTDCFDKSKYLKEHLVIKSDDDINEIVEKINYVKENREKIIEEYKKITA